MERIAIFGAGAVGSYLGAFMTRQGEDITSSTSGPPTWRRSRPTG